MPFRSKSHWDAAFQNLHALNNLDKLRRRRQLLMQTLRLVEMTLTLLLSQQQRLAGQTVIAQISDIHMCNSHAPHAAANLSAAVQIINKASVNAVIVSGDIGEYKACWLKVKSILAAVQVPVYYVPGNHDVNTTDVSVYRGVFGPDYYRIRIKNVDIIVIDSQLLGNFDNYNSSTPPPLPPYTQSLSTHMIAWLTALVPAEKRAILSGHVVIAVQHIPAYRDSGFPPGTNPYWIISNPYRTKEMNVLHSLGVKDVLSGHWHYGKVFDAGNITWHSAPSTGWLPWGGTLGLAIHTISPAGNVSTQFIDLPSQVP